MNYSLNLSTTLVLRLIELGEKTEDLRCLTEAQQEALRRLAAELRCKIEEQA